MTFATMFILAIALAATAGYVLGYGMSASGEDHRAREREAEYDAKVRIIIDGVLTMARTDEANLEKLQRELEHERETLRHLIDDRALAWNKHWLGEMNEVERN